MGVSTSPGRIIAEPSKETSLRTDRLSHSSRRMSLFLQTLVLRSVRSYAFEIADVRGDYLRDCDFRRFAGTPLRLLVAGFVVLAA